MLGYTYESVDEVGGGEGIAEGAEDDDDVAGGCSQGAVESGIGKEDTGADAKGNKDDKDDEGAKSDKSIGVKGVEGEGDVEGKGNIEGADVEEDVEDADIEDADVEDTDGEDTDGEEDVEDTDGEEDVEDTDGEDEGVEDTDGEDEGVEDEDEENAEDKGDVEGEEGSGKWHWISTSFVGTLIHKNY